MSMYPLGQGGLWFWFYLQAHAKINLAAKICVILLLVVLTTYTPVRFSVAFSVMVTSPVDRFEMFRKALTAQFQLEMVGVFSIHNYSFLFLISARQQGQLYCSRQCCFRRDRNGCSAFAIAGHGDLPRTVASQKFLSSFPQGSIQTIASSQRTG